MISVNDALELIQSKVKTANKSIFESLNDANGFVLADDYYSKLSFPPFDQSAMDGYALNKCDNDYLYNIIGEIKAGDDGNKYTLKRGDACRIFTGAMLPKNANCVVKQEDIEIYEEKVKLNKPISIGENVRKQGEQIKKNELAVKKGSFLNPGAIGFLAKLGCEKVKVYTKPKISIIATGNELIAIGNKLENGKIFESNTVTLLSALQHFGFNATIQVVKDSFQEIKTTISQAIKNSELVLITGGISVGDYDFVGDVLNDLNVEEGFYKVKQKPGKPLFFGTQNNKVIFALPGNPASVLTSFYIYVLPALQKLIGRESVFLMTNIAKLNTDFEKSEKLTVFLKGRLDKGVVDILPFQASSMLGSFIEANCLIKLNEGCSKYKKNQLVEVLMLH